eukprot:SAG11_NODE_1650_length_4510_cov_6.795738_4_plen_97_part_00
MHIASEGFEPGWKSLRIRGEASLTVTLWVALLPAVVDGDSLVSSSTEATADQRIGLLLVVHLTDAHGWVQVAVCAAAKHLGEEQEAECQSTEKRRA